MIDEREKQVDEEYLRKCYLDVFETESGKIVLMDLANHCFKNDTTIMKEENKTQFFANEGRRQVLLHIETMLK
jgi:hypothetical protein